MKRFLFFSLVISLLVSSLSGCGTTSTKTPGRIPGDSEVAFLTAEHFSSDRMAEDVGIEFRAAYADFALRLLAACNDSDGRLVSPLSVMTALLMVANGACGETREQFEQVLGGYMKVEKLNQELFNYYESLKVATSENARIDAANAVWMVIDFNFKVAEDFIRVISNTFDAQLAQGCFTDPKTVDAINEWSSQHTDGMIPKILEYSDVNEDTIMVLLNAILFDALWREPYEDYQCRQAEFTAADDTKKNVTMMYCDEHMYLSGEYETGFVKGYRGGYAFVALLPKEEMAMNDYLATLDGARFMELMNGQEYASVKTGLPKFSFDWSDSLKDALITMGLTNCFDGQTSDLSDLGTYEPYEYSFVVSNVIHKTHIDVDESGTRAAAVTAVIVDGYRSFEENRYEVILDRPFVYAIIDTTNMLPVFIGTATNLG